MDRPWSLPTGQRVSPLRAQPWLGETVFKILNAQGPIVPSSGAPIAISDESLPSPESPAGAAENSSGLMSALDKGPAESVPEPASSSSYNRSQPGQNTYGPVRHRSSSPRRSSELIRPPAVLQHDFSEILEEMEHASNKRSHSPVQAEDVSNKVPRVESATEMLLIEALLTEKHRSVVPGRWIHPEKAPD